jgi:hypothetical protein
MNPNVSVDKPVLTPLGQPERTEDPDLGRSEGITTSGQGANRVRQIPGRTGDQLHSQSLLLGIKDGWATVHQFDPEGAEPPIRESHCQTARSTHLEGRREDPPEA